MLRWPWLLQHDPVLMKTDGSMSAIGVGIMGAQKLAYMACLDSGGGRSVRVGVRPMRNESEEFWFQIPPCPM